jgi:hypothetical protein
MAKQGGKRRWVREVREMVGQDSPKDFWTPTGAVGTRGRSSHYFIFSARERIVASGFPDREQKSEDASVSRRARQRDYRVFAATVGRRRGRRAVLRSHWGFVASILCCVEFIGTDTTSITKQDDGRSQTQSFFPVPNYFYHLQITTHAIGVSFNARVPCLLELARDLNSSILQTNLARPIGLGNT